MTQKTIFSFDAFIINNKVLLYCIRLLEKEKRKNTKKHKNTHTNTKETTNKKQKNNNEFGLDSNDFGFICHVESIGMISAVCVVNPLPPPAPSPSLPLVFYAQQKHKTTTATTATTKPTSCH